MGAEPSDHNFSKLNDDIVKSILKTIKDHNEISYRKVGIVVPLVEFTMINKSKLGVRDPISKQMVKFYESYIPYVIVATNLKKIVDMINYTNEDLVLHIDRSSDSILQIMSGLTKHRVVLSSRHDELLNNLDQWVTKFVETLTQNITADSNMGEVIPIIFACMEQNGLSARLGEEVVHTHGFIPAGYEILTGLSGSFAKSDKLLVQSLNSSLKQTILAPTSINESIREKLNRLQTFNIVPDEGAVMDLNGVVQSLFGFEIKKIGPLSASVNSLAKILQMVTRDTGVPTGLFIVTSANVDTYFDISGLMTLAPSNPSSGVTESAVTNTTIIRDNGGSANVKESKLIAINIDAEQTRMAFALWTNDLLMFKVRKLPIYQPIIGRMARGSPSTTIEAYNEVLSRSIRDVRSDDAVSFNQVKYMSFSEEVTEASFLSGLVDKIVGDIMSMTSKLKASELTDTVVDTPFALSILDVIDDAKRDMGIHPSLLPSHCHIIYASMSNSILGSIKRGLTAHIGSGGSLSKETVLAIVRECVETNDTIYSRVIASYYLHKA